MSLEEKIKKLKFHKFLTSYQENNLSDPEFFESAPELSEIEQTINDFQRKISVNQKIRDKSHATADAINKKIVDVNDFINKFTQEKRLFLNKLSENQLQELSYKIKKQEKTNTPTFIKVLL